MYDCIYRSDLSELRKFLESANNEGWEIISVTEKIGYTIIYKTKKR